MITITMNLCVTMLPNFILGIEEILLFKVDKTSATGKVFHKTSTE